MKHFCIGILYEWQGVSGLNELNRKYPMVNLSKFGSFNDTDTAFTIISSNLT